MKVNRKEINVLQSMVRIGQDRHIRNVREVRFMGKRKDHDRIVMEKICRRKQ